MTFAILRINRRDSAESKKLSGAYALLLLCLSLGCLVSSLFGDLFGIASPLQVLYFGSSAYAPAILFVYLVVAIFLATSFIGFLLLPIAAFIRGYLFCIASASIIAGYQSAGILMALTVIGIPALFSLPSFIYMSAECFLHSRGLLYRVRNLDFKYKGRPLFTAVVCFCLTGASALMELYLVPYLVSLLKG